MIPKIVMKLHLTEDALKTFKVGLSMFEIAQISYPLSPKITSYLWQSDREPESFEVKVPEEYLK